MQDEITSAVVSAVKFIAYYIIWSVLLFNLGRACLLLVSFGQYPRGRDIEHHANRIAMTGVFVLALAWTAVAIYNNTVGSNV